MNQVNEKMKKEGGCFKANDSIIKVFSLLMCLAPWQVFAQCEADKQVLGAVYELTTSDKVSGASSTRHFVLWRNGEQVAHEFIDAHKTELWERAGNGQLRTVHYFDYHKRGIEYEPIEIKIKHSQADWQLKYHLFSERFIERLEFKKTEGISCQESRQLVDNSAGKDLVLDWLTHFQLAKQYQEETHNKIVRWTLRELITDKQAVKNAFEKRSDYYLTDYTDIGDNESDPFLMNMINLGHIAHGASGFYDQYGNDIGDSHHHAH